MPTPDTPPPHTPHEQRKRSEPVSAAKDAVIGAAATGLASAARTVESFVYLAGQSGLYEIEAGKIALARSRRPDVKALATKMIADHKDIAAKLGSFVAAIDEAKPPPETLDAVHQALIDDLEGASADDFDHRYLEQQQDAHKTAITLLKTYGGHGDNEALRNLAKLALPTLEAHLEMVRQAKGAHAPDKA